MGKITHFNLYNRILQDIAILMYNVQNGLCPDHIFRLLIIISSNQYYLIKK